MNPTHGSDRMKLITLRKSEKCIYTTISSESVYRNKELAETDELEYWTDQMTPVSPASTVAWSSSGGLFPRVYLLSHLSY